MNFSRKELNEMVAQASAEGACAKEIRKAKRAIGNGKICSHPNVHYWAYWYARNIIKGKWPEGEEAIKKHPASSYRYAYYVIKGRWPEGEEIISTDIGWHRIYEIYIFKKEDN
jgi:hypothetical protein